MSIDVFDGWGTKRAMAILDHWPGCVFKPSLKGPRKGAAQKYGASYQFDGAFQRHVVIDLVRKSRGVAMTVNARSVSGEPYPAIGIENVLEEGSTPSGHEGKNGNPGIRTSVNRNASLKPKDNDLLHLYIRNEDAFQAVIRWYSGESPPAPVPPVDGPPEPSATVVADVVILGDVPSQANPEQGLSLEDLLARLAANTETGRLGELVAIAHEQRRLRDLGCSAPEMSVVHTSLSRVDAGFDIESNWNGERRCIEVKSTTTNGDDFFISENERVKLLALGSQAWLYRVIVGPGGSGEVVEILQDPIGQVPRECFHPVVWRVRRSDS